MNITYSILKKLANIEDMLHDISNCSASSKDAIIASALLIIEEIKGDILHAKKEISLSPIEVKRIMAQYNFYDMPEVECEEPVDVSISFGMNTDGQTKSSTKPKTKTMKSKAKKAK